MQKKREEKHPIITRVSPEMYEFLRHTSFEKRISVNSIVTDCLEKYKKRIEKGVDTK
jgi:predicted HicB family RNase H-like nuclease